MTLKEIIEQLESCNYECEGGPLVNNEAWIELKRMAEIGSLSATPIKTLSKEEEKDLSERWKKRNRKEK